MISQYANSPRYLELYNGLTDIFSNAKTLEDWYNVVFNIKTATGFGLDIWGEILNQSRLLHYTNPKLVDVSLKNDAVTICSGSILWIPNGGNYINSVAPRDFTNDDTFSGTGTYFVFWGGNKVILYNEEDVYSGSEPSPTNQNAIWYDVSNNLIKTTTDGGTNWITSQISLPVAKVTADDGEITSISSIFNGFGYFANTIFVVPGISGYVPDGKTTDNQNKNEYFEIENVTMYQNSSVLGQTQYIYYDLSDGNLHMIDDYVESTIEPLEEPCLWFDLTNNVMKIKENVGDDWSIVQTTMFLEVFGDSASTVPTGIHISNIYSENNEVIYLQGAQVVNGVQYTSEQIEELYRMVLFLKAMSNITNATVKSLNDMFLEYFNGQCFVYEYDVMKIRVVVRFFTTKIDRAILTTLLPKPTGVLMGLEFLESKEYFGFFVNGLTAEEQTYAPADQKPFYW